MSESEMWMYQHKKCEESAHLSCCTAEGELEQDLPRAEEALFMGSAEGCVLGDRDGERDLSDASLVVLIGPAGEALQELR